MKTEMSEDGVITIRPESSVEAYALRRWMACEDFQVHDAATSKVCMHTMARICIDATWSQEKIS